MIYYLSIELHNTKFYHLGFGKNVTRSCLAKANERTNYKILKEFAYKILEVAKSNAILQNLDVDIDAKRYSLIKKTALPLQICLLGCNFVPKINNVYQF